MSVARVNPHQPGETVAEDLRNALALLDVQVWGDSRREQIEGVRYDAEHVVEAMLAAQARIKHALAAIEGRRYRENPEIIVYGNPPVGRVRRFGGGRVVGILSRDVHKVWYTHAETGEDHYHDFEPGDLLIAVESGGQRDLVLTNEDGRPLWGEFD